MSNNTETAAEQVRNALLAMKDSDYAEFVRPLLPSVAADRIIGIRTPALRAFAKDFSKSPLQEGFLSALPHFYYEENCLHAFLIQRMRDFDACISALDAFLPYVDNWATCDSLRPAVLGKHREELMPHIRRWAAATETYTVRFALEMLMVFCLDEGFSPWQAELAASVKSDDYYVIMMQAWYFATALAKQRDAAMPYIEEKKLNKQVHNKTIQKAVESYRISDADKVYLKTLRIK